MKDRQYLQKIAEFLKPPPDITVSEWADMHRILTPQTSPEPGRYRTMRTPYAKKIMDAFSDIDIEHIVVMKGTQLGMTEAMLNILGYIIDYDPSPTLIVYPTEELARYVARNRIQPMLESSQRLREKLPQNPDDYTTYEIRFSSMVLSICGSNSPAQLASRPIRFLLRDEIDKFPFTAGNEADPMSLSAERTKNFWNRKIFDISTPTTEAGNVYKEMISCDEIYDYYVPCPHCGKYQKLVFEQIDFHDEREYEKVRAVADYRCEYCNRCIDNRTKTKIIALGEWRGRKGVKTPKKIGFHLPAWLSPWLTWGDCAVEFLRSREIPEKMMNFVNSWKAEPWIYRYQTKDVVELKNNMIDIPEFFCKEGTVALTAGIDPGQGGAWFVVLGWESDLSCHVVHYGFIPLPSGQGWGEIAKLVYENAYPIVGSEKRLQIWRAGIDVGGGKYADSIETQTEMVYDFIRQYGGEKIKAVKGASGSYLLHKIKISTLDESNSKAASRGIEILTIDTAAFKDAIWYRINQKESGRMTFNKDCRDDIFKHILSEEKRRDKRGRVEWVKIARDNHLLDCIVIAYAMADPEYLGGIKYLATVRNSNENLLVKKSSWRI